MFKKYLLIYFLVFTSSICLSQPSNKVYHFINEELPANEFGKSTWGIFYIDQPAVIDSAIIERLVQSELSHTPDSIKTEFINQCYAMIEASRKFIWQQNLMDRYIVVNNVKQHLFADSILPFMSPSVKAAAAQWIIEWNKTKPGERLINYSSIPLFSNDGQYVLILRGQSVTSEGWDTLYIYKKNKEKWEIVDKIIITSI